MQLEEAETLEEPEEKMEDVKKSSDLGSEQSNSEADYEIKRRTTAKTQIVMKTNTSLIS